MNGKTVFITGASRGIGRSIAAAFAKNGYNLGINSLNSAEELILLSKELSAAYKIKCIPFVGNAGDIHFIKDVFLEMERQLYGVDILINNAGISYMGLLPDMSIDEWNQILQTNLTSVFCCCKYAVPHMLQKKYGKIINISSVWGNTGASCEVAYSATKGGINAFTKALAKELAPSNIQVNAIACGIIDTKMNAILNQSEKLLLENDIPAGRFGTADEVAELVYSIVNNSPYLTGQVIALDGGWI